MKRNKIQHYKLVLNTLGLLLTWDQFSSLSQPTVQRCCYGENWRKHSTCHSGPIRNQDRSCIQLKLCLATFSILHTCTKQQELYCNVMTAVLTFLIPQLTYRSPWAPENKGSYNIINSFKYFYINTKVMLYPFCWWKEVPNYLDTKQQIVSLHQKLHLSE